MKTQTNNTRRSRLATIAVVAALALVGLWSQGAGAQESAPEGATCERVDSGPVTEFTMPGDHGLAILELEDGTEVSLGPVTDGQVVTAPGDVPIVAVFKCELAEEEPEEEEETEEGEVAPAEGEREEELATTGADPWTLAFVGATLVVGGGLLVRRRDLALTSR